MEDRRPSNAASEKEVNSVVFAILPQKSSRVRRLIMQAGKHRGGESVAFPAATSETRSVHLVACG